MAARLPSPSSASSVSLAPSPAALTAASELVRKVRVPHIPEVVLALRKELSRPEPALRVVAELIVQDPAITGDLLKVINSPVFNLRAKVTSVQQAAAMMGVQRLTNYVTAVAVKRMVEAMDARVLGVWEDILEEARVIVAVARVTKGVSDDEAYLFGLLHDVGSLIFASHSGDYISQWAFRNSSEPRLLVAYEQAAMGVDHGTVGFLLARNWQLPESLALAIAHHHASEQVETDDSRVSHLIALAKLAHYLIALSRGTQELPEMLAYLEEAWRDVDIGEAEWSALCQRAQVGLWDHVA